MKLRLFAATAAAAFAMISAGSASAVTVTVLSSEPGNLTGGPGFYSGLAYGHQIIYDFDTAIDPNYSWSFNNAALSYQRDGSLGLDPGQSAPPPVPVDPNNPNGAYTYGDSEYWTVENGGSATLTALGRAMRGFSFYFGSPDEYNHVQFTFASASGSVTVSGEDLWTNLPEDLNGDQSWGRRVYYSFDGPGVQSITFTSTGNSFEFDGLAAIAVPEPATWALMIGGFGMAGAMIRRRRSALA